MRILIGGDVHPSGRSEGPFLRGDAEAIFTDLLDEFRSADFTAVNLECPLIREASPAQKIGPVLGAPAECIEGIRTAGIRAVGLANNHILDHGPLGLSSTLSICDSCGVRTLGAGMDLSQASQPLIETIRGSKVGFVAAAEHEFSVASETSPGANPLDMIRVVRVLRHLREHVALVIVLLHGGNEFYPYPSPRLQSVCRFLVEEGANIVVCQHSHRAGCLEQHGDGHIVYGQGNLVFDDYPRGQSFWYEGFLVDILVQDGRPPAVKPIPFRQYDAAAAVRRLHGADEESFLEALARRSEQARDEAFLRGEWERFCRRHRSQYLSYLSGFPRWARYLNARLPFVHHTYPPRRRLLVRSVIQCESHRDVLETVLSADGGREVQP